MELRKQFPVFFNYFIVSVMMVCVAASIIDLFAAFAPAWSGNYLLVVVFVVALEGLYAARSTRHIPFPSRTWFAYRGTELVVILVGLKVLLYVMRSISVDQVMQEIQLWQQDFLINFFSGEYLAASLVVVAVWVLSQQFNTQLMELEADEETLERERKYEFRNDRGAARQRMMLKVVLIGMGLLVLTVATRVYLRTQGGEASAAHIGILNLLLYIFLGLLLLSQTRFSALRALWYRERADIGRELAVRWLSYSVMFLVIIAFIAALLPTRYSLSLLDTLRYLLGVVVLLIQLLMYLILLLLSVPLNWLMSLLGQPPAGAPAPPEMPPPPPEPPAATPTSDPLLDLLSSIVFWAILMIIVVYSLNQFLRRHQGLVMALRRIPVLGWLMQIAQNVWGALRQWNRQLAGAINAGIRRLQAQRVDISTPAPPRFISLRRLSPRERIQYFYLAMVQRGGQRGLARHPSQTPREYAQTLDAAIPDANEDVDALTESFVEARYSRHDVNDESASRVQRYWERVKAALRRR
jgi:hypothetical protein